MQAAQKQLITSKRNSAVAKEEIAFLKDQLLQELTNQPLTRTLRERLEQFGIHLNYYFIVAFQLVPMGNDVSSL